MNRSETDLRDALGDLARQADQHGAPSTADILAAASARRPSASRVRRPTRWLAPLTAAAAVVAATVLTVMLTSGGNQAAPSGHRPQTSTAPSRPPSAAQRAAQRAAQLRAASAAAAARARAAAASRAAVRSDPAVQVLEDAAARLDRQRWTPPAPDRFFYRRTTDGRHTTTSWTSVSGTRVGETRTTGTGTMPVEACAHGHYAAGSGAEGACTLADVGHYRADAPTTPSAWDAYLEAIAPGAKAAHAQGKIIQNRLFFDLLSPAATAALLRYTATCPGLRTFATPSVDGRALIGVTCSSMTTGSIALAFDAGSHAYAGLAPVATDGTQAGPADVVTRTGVVDRIGVAP